jgi:sphinganine-1-phosphate aldolase
MKLNFDNNILQLKYHRMNRHNVRIPQNGLDGDDIILQLKELKSSDASWRNGRMFGYTYLPGAREAKIIEQAYQLFYSDNALNPSLFASLRVLENETVAMVAELLHATDECAGNLTTGGSESILVAVKTARDWAKRHKPFIKNPEIIAPVTIHPAFSKAADMTGVHIRYASLTPDKKVNPAEVDKLINGNTIMIAVSAPCFPYGVIDPVEEVAPIALKNELLLHVDCCLGGLMLPFVETLGYPVPPFDFRVKGVTSISADVHKYGYASKGSSVILYRTHELRKFQYFVFSDWPGGLYASPTMLGTRSGAPIAAAWAALKTIGMEGYLKMAQEVMSTTKKIQEAINSIPGLHVIGAPAMCVFSFTSEKHDIYLIGDELAAAGWNLDKLQFPPALHMTISNLNSGHEDEFIAALKDAIAITEGHKIKAASSHVVVYLAKALSKFLPDKWFRKLSSKFTGLMNKGEGKGSGTGAAAYGIMASIDNRENVDEIMLDVLDKLYTV